jgi:DNA repair exonuclease SbcCD ATPase subunit
MACSSSGSVARPPDQRRQDADTISGPPARIIAGTTKREKIPVMSTPEPHRDATSDEAINRRRNPWIWVSAALGLIAVGLLIWGLNTKSDLDDARKDVDQLEAQISQGKQTGSAAAASYESAYNDLQQQLGTTQEDLATTEKDLEQAEQDAAQADKDAAAAKQEVAQAGNQTDKANAEAKQAQAEAQAAESKATVTAECAKAYLSSLGALFEGDNPSAQASAVGEDLKSITDSCKKALAGP